jgi:phosphohistidine phosphatase
MNLLLMRHAKSSWADGDLDDHERPLNARGREAAPRMAKVLVENGIVPQLILVSSSVRTRETVERMLPVIGDVPVKVVKGLYHASPMTLLEIIHSHGAGADPLMVVGHNPGMETTVSNIAGNLVPFPTGAVAHAVITPGEASVVEGVWRPNELPPE